MRTIGLIGGMSWVSTAEYYRLVNEGIGERLGGWHSARCVIHSVDFAEIEQLQREGEWDAAAEILSASGTSLVAAGAEVVLLCTNTMHHVADAIESELTVPFIHIAKATGERILQAGIRHVALLGTAYTMEMDFCRSPLEAMGIAVTVPDEGGREMINRVIYYELCEGRIEDSSRKQFVDVIEGLIRDGCQGVVLGCTEIPLLIGQEDVSAPVFETTRIHSEAAVEFALS
ncbi:TPA: aspartate/glutamate racemase [Candidatus Latescibacteria bacterium]|nr:aspartate/glutamate racemase [Candidatus Latescibacterota bacterium]|tara:strand:- start:243 stop:932 length:690 start_codon:yes stop_codon:yes gene_type:complete